MTRLCVLFVLVAPLSAQEPGKLEIPALFSDHMVIQAERAVPVWGWSDPVANIQVRMGDEVIKTQADAEGNWRVKLQPRKAGGPHQLIIEGSERKLTVKDVLVGEVWLGSGQSNMAFRVSQAKDKAKEIAAAKHPQIRMFTVARNTRRTPQTRLKGAWQVCSPKTVGGFSATAYFFGRALHRSLQRPVGLINSSWGGTAIEAWTSMDVQKGRQDLEPILAQWHKQAARWSAASAEKDFKKRLAQWQKRAAAARAAGKRPPRRPRKAGNPALNQNHPANLYNGMIAPLIPYAIRGAVWYQGERNARTLQSGYLYREQMPLLIHDWRSRWGQGDFPFGIVQLPNFKKRNATPGQSTAWAMIRESMLRTLAVKNTGLAITIDVGEANNIHPKNKQAVGDRLGRWALATVYGKDVVASGPLVSSSSLEGRDVVLTYNYAAGGLKTGDGKPVRGFAIAGRDRRWRWAHAKIAGDVVLVSHPQVAHPVAVRYAWGDNPDCNLVNQVGLPASPFRTDDWAK